MCNCKKSNRRPLRELKKDYDELKKQQKDLEKRIALLTARTKNHLESDPLIFED